MAGVPDGFDVNDPTCPKCGGPMWDNRKKKASGDYKASRSDFSCKDKDDCGFGIWLEGKGAKKKAEADGAAAPAARVTPLTPEEQKSGRDRILFEYFRVYMPAAARSMKAIAEEHKLPLSMDDVQAATISVVRLMNDRKLLVDGTKHPLKVPAKAEAPARPAPAPAPRPAPKPAPKPEPVGPRGETFDDFPPALQDQDDDLPF